VIAHAERRKLKDGAFRWYAIYLAPDGRRTSEGGFDTKREAERLAHRRAIEIEGGTWVDPSRNRMTFAQYVERYYWPAARHLEPTTQAAYRSNLDRHFLPEFGDMPMRRIVASVIQAWVNEASDHLAPASVVKYHTFLHSIFKRAVTDRVVAYNPCDGTRLPKVVRKPKRAVTPEEFDTLLASVPVGFQTLVLVAIETGMRWGEVIALRPVDIDFSRSTIAVGRVVLEVSKKITPGGNRYVTRDYPKDDESREIQVGGELCQLLRQHMVANGIRDTDLMFSTKVGTPISRNTFRTRVWLPSLASAGLREKVRFHDLRGAHASWLLAGGADLKVVMDRLGHRQIATTQQYLGSLPDAGDRAVAAFRKVRGRSTGLSTAN
jgi:integrase